MTPVEHLSELRKRFFIIIIVALAGTITCYVYIDTIIDLLLKPVQKLQFIYLTPPELFLAYLKVAVVTGLIITSPIIFMQIWLFIRPGLRKKEKIYLVLSLFFGFFLFLLGGFFAYRVIIPMTIRFFVNFQTPTIEPNFSFGSYISFISSILLAFGIVFELPILIIVLAKLKLISARTLKKFRKYIILVIFVVGAFLTPPDVISQILLAGPMIVLFEISIIIASFINKGDEDDEDDEI